LKTEIYSSDIPVVVLLSELDRRHVIPGLEETAEGTFPGKTAAPGL